MVWLPCPYSHPHDFTYYDYEMCCDEPITVDNYGDNCFGDYMYRRFDYEYIYEGEK